MVGGGVSGEIMRSVVVRVGVSSNAELRALTSRAAERVIRRREVGLETGVEGRYSR